MSKKKPATIGRPVTGQMPQYQFRMPAKEHAQAKAIAKKKGVTLTELIRDFLMNFVKQNK